MSSPPSPTTSTRAATLSSRKERRSASFPSIGSLNPFRSKSAPQPSIPAEPFLVAPGIWSTDATAKVFGYLDPWINDKSKVGRSKSAGPHKKKRSQTPSSGRRPLPGKSLVNRYNEVHKDDGTDDFSHRTHRQHREAWERARQEGRDEAKLERDESDRRLRRGKMASMSRDDELTERGANPRTGIISPFIRSEDSGSAVDYISRGYDRSPLSQGTRRTSSGRWKQDGASWSLVGNEIPSPTKLSAGEKPSREVSVKRIQDKLLAQMPGVDNPEPDNMTSEQIKRYQHSVERAYKLAGGSHATLDPETLPTPRVLTPEGPRTPPNEIRKIRRKEVGSALIPRNESDETAIINQKQRSASARPLPSMKLPSMDKQQVRIISPSMAALGVPPRTPLDIPSSFLGQPQQCSRTVSAGQFQSKGLISPQTNQQPHHNQPPPHAEKRDPLGAPSAARASSPTLKQCLPRLEFLHPSHFANLESSSFRRPVHLLPPSLRSGPQKRQLVEDAATITTTTTSPKTDRRPRMQRQEGNHVVPRASHHNLGNHMGGQGYPHTNVPCIKVFEPMDPEKPIIRISNVNSSKGNRSPSYPSPQNQDTTQGSALKVSHHRPANQRTNHTHPQETIPVVRVCTPTRSPGPREDFPDQTMDQIHHIRQRPSQLHHNGTEGIDIPASLRSPASRETFQGPTHANFSMVKEPSNMKPALNTSSVQPRSTHLSPQYRRPSNTDGVPEVARAARVAMLGDKLHQHQYQSRGSQPRQQGTQAASGKRSSARNARSIALEESGGEDGITRTIGHHGEQNALAATSGNVMNKAVKARDFPPIPDLVPSPEGGVCFAGNWATDSDEGDEEKDVKGDDDDQEASNEDDEDDTKSITTAAINAEESLTRRRSLLKRGQEIAQYLAAIEGVTQPRAYLAFAQESLCRMVIHVASTLHHGSPALRTLRSTNPKVKVGSREYLNAVKEVALAGVYLLLLLNLVLILRKVVLLVARVVYWVWHPFSAVGVVVRWCLIV